MKDERKMMLQNDLLSNWSEETEPMKRSKAMIQLEKLKNKENVLKEKKILCKVDYTKEIGRKTIKIMTVDKAKKIGVYDRAIIIQ